MKTVILNLGDSSQENGAISKLVDCLKNCGYSLSCNFHCDDDVAFIYGTLTQPAIGPAEENEIQNTDDIDVIVVPLSSTTETELDNQANIMTPNQTENNTMNLEPCTILSLSTACCVESQFDENLEYSVLKASNVSRDGDHVVFDYCGLTFKYPAALSELMVTNIDPVVKETSINVAINFRDCDTYFVMLCVCEKEESEEAHIVFGKDLIEIIKNK